MTTSPGDSLEHRGQRAGWKQCASPGPLASAGWAPVIAVSRGSAYLLLAL